MADALRRLGIRRLSDSPKLLRPCLTYVNLPWWSMVEDVLEKPVAPVFDKFGGPTKKRA